MMLRCLMLELLCFLPSGLTQVTTSSVAGFVTDSSSAAVAGATVIIKEVKTGFNRTATTDGSGQYSILAIPAGTYDFTVQKTGFERAERNGQTITQQISARVDFVLEVGTVNQTVNVKGDQPLLETETPANSVTLSSQQITELPTFGHNYLQTAFLSPGVNPIASNSMLTVTVANAGSGGAAYKPTSVSVSGGRPDFVAFVNDGFDVTDPGYGGDLFEVSPEALSSYRIVRGFDNAQYGGEPSIVYVSTKSGTNDYHGSVWEYHQDAALRARNWNSQTVPPLTYNLGGFTLGGPALPQLKNKTFLFGEFQMTRTRSSSTGEYTVPTAAQWQGNLSSIPEQLYNPFAVNPLTQTRLPFPNNQIPVSLLSPVAQKYQKYFPTPNLANATYGSYNYVTNSKSITDDTQFLLRMDQYLPHNGRLFVKYFKDNVNSESEGITPLVGFGTPLKGQTAAVEWTQGLAANMLNTLRLGLYRSWVFFGAIPTSTDVVGSLGLKNYSSDPVHWSFPVLSITGMSAPSSVGYDYNWWTTRVGLNDDFSYIKGRHTLDFGGVVQPTQYAQKDGAIPRGSLSYDGSFTRQSPTSPANPVGFGDFLLGAFSTSQNGQSLDPVLSTGYFSWYVQDKIKAGRKITITLGVRWDWWRPPVERYNRWGTWDQDKGEYVWVLKNPFNYQQDHTTLSGDYPRGMFLNWKKTNFSPRVGVAYLLTPKTTIRAGAGMYYSQGLQNFQDFSSFSGGAPPFQNVIVVQNDPGTLTPERLDSTLFDLPIVNAISPGSAIVAPDIHAPQPYVIQGTFSVERQVGDNIVLSIGYNGAFGRHLNDGGTNQNQAALYNPDNPLPLSQRLPYPNYGFIFLQSDNSNSSYNAMYLNFTKRFSHGLSVIASYTWSKSLDEYTSTGAGGNNQNALCLRCDYGLSDNNRTNYLSIGYVWELPFGPGRTFLAQGLGSQILGNWQLSGITQLQSGLPLTPRVSNSWLNIGTFIGYARTDRVCNGALTHPTIEEFFNVSCFPVQPPNTFGNSGRNVIIGPGSQLWDVSLARIFRIFKERVNLNVRVEAYSIFNHQNWGEPDTSAFDPTFGQISSKTDPRTLQLGVKLSF